MSAVLLHCESALKQKVTDMKEVIKAVKNDVWLSSVVK